MVIAHGLRLVRMSDDQIDIATCTRPFSCCCVTVHHVPGCPCTPRDFDIVSCSLLHLVHRSHCQYEAALTVSSRNDGLQATMRELPQLEWRKFWEESKI